MKRTETGEKLSHVLSIVMLALCIVWGIEVVSCTLLVNKANAQLEKAEETLASAKEAIIIAKDYRDEALKLHVGSLGYIQEATR